MGKTKKKSKKSDGSAGHKIDTNGASNTENAPFVKKKEPIKRTRYWSLTLNNYTPRETKKLLNRLDAHPLNAYIIAKEKVETPHLQGYIRFKNCRTRRSLIKWNHRIHWEECKDSEALMDYCQKTESYDGKRWIKNLDIPKDTYNPLANKIMFKWQVHLEKLWHTEPDDRQIIWIYDEEGCSGKTQFIKYMEITYPDTWLIKSSYTDSASQTMDNPHLLMFNITRSYKNFSYSALEDLKDGIMISGKYKGRRHLFKPPHIWVFANERPNELKMSADRWKIINIKDF